MSSSDVNTTSSHPALLDAAERAVRNSTARRGTLIRDTRSVAARLGEAAIRLFVERGFDNVTVADIAVEAGVTSRTFHRYFPSKEVVITDITDLTNERLLELIGKSDRPTMLEALQEAVGRWLREHEALFASIAKISNESDNLMSAILLNTSKWEDHVGEALHARFPGSVAVDARIMGAVMMGVLRVAQAESNERGVSSIEETERLMNRLNVLVTIGHDA